MTALVGSHYYSAVSVDEQAGTLVVRNPWGVDGGTGNDGSNDGLITLSANSDLVFCTWTEVTLS